jgi:hemoglobin
MDIAPPPAGRYPWGDQETPYLQLGDDDKVRLLADTFYDIVEQSAPGLRAMLPADTSVSRQKLYEFLSGWMGGPPLYWERRGHPALRMRHAPFTIGEHEAREWARCMDEAVAVVVDDADLATFLSRELGRAAAQLQNSHDVPSVD